MKQYKFRISDAILAEKLEGKGAVLVQGPKWCGKTTTAEQLAGSILYMAEPDKMEQNIKLGNYAPSSLLDGATPRLIDEWQLVPKLWDAVRFEVDHRDELGQFILTGSAVPVNSDEIFHTGTGRFAWLTMRTMSLFESGDSVGEISLGELFNRPEHIVSINPLDINKLAYVTCRGGWPQACTISKPKIALAQAFDYYDAIVSADISRVDNVNKDPERVKRLMRSYARNQGTQTSIAKLKADMLANDTDTLDDNTVASYINALKKIFVVDDMLAWNPNLRSKAAVRSADTRYFSDSSIAVAALGLGPQDLINDLNTFGFLFEALCVHDLRVYADALDGMVYHYRDSNGLECDAVIHLRNGSYGLVEIKLGGDDMIEQGAASLKLLSKNIDTTRMKAPSFLMVLTGLDGFAYQREDGVYVVPIGCLRN